MKVIFDFDDVLLKSTGQFKNWIFDCIQIVGVPRERIESYYKETRSNQFSLRNFINTLFVEANIQNISVEETYKKILEGCKSFINEKLVEVVKSTGKENCYIVTNGDFEYQMDKVDHSGVKDLFSEIYVVPGSKKEVIEKICVESPEEKVIFVDNREEFFSDIDMEKCKNLKTVLFDENGIENLLWNLKNTEL